jgi:hypothetical protein
MKKLLLTLTALILLSGCDVDANQAYYSCNRACKNNEECMGETYTLGCLQNCTEIIAKYYNSEK